MRPSENRAYTRILVYLIVQYEIVIALDSIHETMDFRKASIGSQCI